MKEVIIKDLITTYNFEDKQFPTRQCSILDLFLTDFCFYVFLHTTNGKPASKYFIMPNIINFLDKYTFSTESLVKQKKSLIQMWNSSHKTKINTTTVSYTYISTFQEKLDSVNPIEDLINLTNIGLIYWKSDINKQSSHCINQHFFATHADVKYSFSLGSYKSINENWTTFSELSASDGSISAHQYQHYHNDLYQAIKIHFTDISSNTATKIKPKIETRKRYNITQKDFVIKTSIFRCINKDHTLEEILGDITIVTPDGQNSEKTVPATLCSECNCYFILKSEFDNLTATGRLLCQIVESEEYYKTGLPNQQQGTGESILMRNGYNVKKNNGLTQEQRQIILKNIVDCNILSPHKIASYLSAFIAQKQNLTHYLGAVEKWNSDRNFILNYKNDSKDHVDVNSIMVTNKKRI